MEVKFIEHTWLKHVCFWQGLCPTTSKNHLAWAQQCPCSQDSHFVKICSSIAGSSSAVWDSLSATVWQAAPQRLKDLLMNPQHGRTSRSRHSVAPELIHVKFAIKGSSKEPLLEFLVGLLEKKSPNGTTKCPLGEEYSCGVLTDP